jgi:hypothetical protein
MLLRRPRLLWAANESSYILLLTLPTCDDLRERGKTRHRDETRSGDFLLLLTKGRSQADALS